MNIKELMDELAAGEQARLQIPELAEQVRRADGEITRLASHNQALELRGRDREDQISGLLARIRSLEVERDDAAFRELEATDKLTTLLKAVRHATADLDGSAMQVDPPKAPVLEPAPEPVKEPEASPKASGEALNTGVVGVQEPNTPQQGQGEPGPTADTIQGSSRNATTAVEPSVAMADTSPAVDTRPWWEKDAEERAKQAARDEHNKPF